MAKIRYVKEPGFVFDSIFIFVLYYNKDEWNKKFVNTDKGQEDIDFYYGILNKFPPFPEELRPFFYMKDNGSCFISSQYFMENLEMFFNGHGMDLLYKELADLEKMKYNIAKFYVDELITPEEIGKYSVYELSKMLLKQNLPNDIKQMVTLFLMEPKVYCDLVIDFFKMLEKMLSKYYSEHYNEIIEVCDKTDIHTIENSFKIAEGSNLKLTEEGSEISVCLINVNLFKFNIINGKTCSIIGINGEEAMRYLGSKSDNIDIPLFGKILSDAGRVNVIKMLATKGELYTGEIAQYLGVASASAYYHIEMMMDAKMLHARSQGRTVYYSINRDYFVAVTAEIMNLLK